jgi:hypothetical protein
MMSRPSPSLVASKRKFERMGMVVLRSTTDCAAVSSRSSSARETVISRLPVDGRRCGGVGLGIFGGGGQGSSPLKRIAQTVRDGPYDSRFGTPLRARQKRCGKTRTFCETRDGNGSCRIGNGMGAAMASKNRYEREIQKRSSSRSRLECGFRRQSPSAAQVAVPSRFRKERYGILKASKERVCFDASHRLLPLVHRACARAGEEDSTLRACLVQGDQNK